MNCENCNKEHDGTYGSGRFCSSKCARSFSSMSKRQETNEKISKTLSGRESPLKGKPGHICSDETKLKISKKIKLFYLEHPEAIENLREIGKNRICSEETRKKLSKNAKEMILSGKIKPWQSRSKIKSSYPEKFFIKVLKNNNIKYKKEFKVDKYFIDFAIEEKRIALEIDGKQHKDRKESDNLKDLCLIKNGWQVYRIAWNQINNEFGKLMMKEKIEKFLEFYNCV